MELSASFFGLLAQEIFPTSGQSALYQNNSLIFVLAVYCSITNYLQIICSRLSLLSNSFCSSRIWKQLWLRVSHKVAVKIPLGSIWSGGRTSRELTQQNVGGMSPFASMCLVSIPYQMALSISVLMTGQLTSSPPAKQMIRGEKGGLL